MALNFRIDTKKSNDRQITLQLSGDFDGSSACELIHMLGANRRKGSRVAIDTDRLKKIYDFGLDVFVRQRAAPTSGHADVQVTGRFRRVFRERELKP